MRWLLFVFLATIYLGGILGSFEFFKARLGYRLKHLRRGRLDQRDFVAFQCSA
ncbi:hypothetical protein [Bradyrhizobium sp. JYMT SZCCT0428]|uniref:hypothetical protein n=1 Tax=Bradyrhizobium sp. JYMT SZCCT0428 TaxID=2807673 RepID=UPI001BABE349|nr:hypothetical protein [Bradyrhizobium sp. JYMT SZCCT0428]MBR1156779.1 hypothetical protein [Bradyrhizobium sp. JYMT SZCCT0428]